MTQNRKQQATLKSCTSACLGLVGSLILSPGPVSAQATESAPTPAQPVATKAVDSKAVDTIIGEGDAGSIARFVGPNRIANSIITQDSGRIGIGTQTPASPLTVNGSADIILQANSTSIASGAFAIRGKINSTTPGPTSAAVRGINQGTGSSGYGIWGSHAGSGPGVRGESIFGTGVSGNSNSGTGVGGVSSSGFGVRGFSNSSTGVVGNSSTGNGVGGTSDIGFGVRGVSNSNSGVSGLSTGGSGVSGVSTTGTGVGAASDSGFGVHAVSASNNGVYGSSTSNDGIVGVSADAAHAGVAGSNSGSGTGIYGESVSGYAGYFAGDVHVAGTLSKNAGSFKIDHPLDPAHKYLSHSFVESPDMMNIYNGNATLNSKGRATVAMPSYFSALNQDFRYQLTAIGAPGPNLFVAREITNNRFEIAGGKPGMKVSWQVTGVRRDAYARDHRIRVEQDKGKDRGFYLYPAGFGQPKTKTIGLARRLESRQPAKPVKGKLAQRPASSKP